MNFYGIVFVVAAGNDAKNVWKRVNLEGQSPHKYGGPNQPLIVVGGVRRDGSVWTDTTTATNPALGILTISALSENIETADARSETGIEIRNGTSFAAPVVAATAAYYMGFNQLYGFDSQNRPNPLQADSGFDLALRVKEYLVQSALQRELNGGDFIGPLGIYNKALLEPGCDQEFWTPDGSNPGKHRRAEYMKRQGNTNVGFFSIDSLINEVLMRM